MNNLTKTQKEILTRLEKEFTSLNAEKSTNMCTLISKEFFDIERVEVDKRIEEIKINNAVVNGNILKMINEDIAKLNKDIEPMGLVANRNKDNYSIRIDIKGEESLSFPNINFSYWRTSKLHYFKNGAQAREFLGFKHIGFYANPNKESYFRNIEELCQNEVFIRKIREEYYKVIKR